MTFFSNKKNQQHFDRLDYKRSLRSRSLNSTTFTLILSCAFIAFYNTAFYRALLLAVDIHSGKGILFATSVLLLVTIAITLMLSLIILPRIAKPLTIFILLAAACASYFMNAYGIVIHHTMIQNILETDIEEATELFNGTMALYIILLGIIPSIWVARVPIEFGNFAQEAIRKLKLWGASLLAIALLFVCFSADYASFFSSHKSIRPLANPINFIYASIYHFSTRNKSLFVAPMGTEASLNDIGQSHSKPTLLILVVGETARADHFSINGYEKATTPRIAQQNIINYRQVTSCGTETSVSVPCMFSNLGRDNYSDKKAKSQEGLLDVIKHSGYSVLWRDNNSGCKGTCDRVSYEDMSAQGTAELCNHYECFDNILLQGLDTKILDMQGSKVIVMHQKGSHGPEYYRRYPETMEVFSPVCRNNKLQACNDEEISNAFDNTIHYTDYFLNNTIEWLKEQSGSYNTALIYLSDHGESLGEKNIYLHGMPYRFAPKEQKHIPFFFWFSQGFSQENRIDSECLRALGDNPYSHDNLFHTTLGLLNIATTLYKPELDMVHPCKAQ